MIEEPIIKISNVQDPPKLDANLFTSRPVMDTEPWRPIRPEFMLPTNNMKTAFGASPTSFDALETGLLPRNKFKVMDHITKNPNEMIFYQSFTNPVFMPETSGIEKLGSADVKPHPLPVSLIDEAVDSPNKPVYSTVQSINISSEIGEKFEHIGGGVIVKKHEQTTPSTLNSTIEIKISSPIHILDTIPTEHSPQSSTSSTTLDKSTQEMISELTSKMSETVFPTDSNKNESEVDEDILSSEATDKLADFLLDLLDAPKGKNSTQDEKLESRIESGEIEKPNFLNIKDIVLNRNKVSNNTKLGGGSSNYTKNLMSKIDETSTSAAVSSTAKSQMTSISHITEKILTTTKPIVTRRKGTGKPKPRPTIPSSTDSGRTTPLTLDDSLLFPSHSKWEYVNGSSNMFSTTTPMKKVFNETLQAWVVENDEKPENHTIRDLAVKRNNTEELQNISLIFDTLVSKLGISPNIPTKIPPFAAFSQNKLKQSQRNETKNKNKTAITTTVKPTTKPTTISTTVKQSTSTQSTIFVPLSSSENHSFTSTTNMIDHQDIENISPEIIVGEAEVEVIDPTKYEEMLSSQSTSTSTSHPLALVTLLPVRSNSGIRTFRPLIKSASISGSGTGTESRRFVYHPKYREAVVKTGIQVTS